MDMDAGDIRLVPVNKSWDDRRIVIGKRYTGLGDCITSLLGAWRFARRTGRALVADWRFSCYSEEERVNVFGKLFATPTELAAVPFLGDDRVNDLRPIGTFHSPEVWDVRRLHEAPFEGERGDRERIMRLLSGSGDVPEDVVVFEHCLAGGFANEEESRAFMGALEPLPVFADEIDRFAERYLAGRYVIGVHVRHGNGGSVMAHAAAWRRPSEVLDRLRRCVESCVRALEERGDQPVVVLVCTDSAVIEKYVRERWPNVVCRPKPFRRVGEGELHLGPCAWQGLQDAVAEMFLLAKSDVLLRYPNSSFADLARCLKRPEPDGLRLSGESLFADDGGEVGDGFIEAV